MHALDKCVRGFYNKMEERSLVKRSGKPGHPPEKGSPGPAAHRKHLRMSASQSKKPLPHGDFLFRAFKVHRKDAFVQTKAGIENMRKNFGAKAYTYPQPVFIIAAYGEDGTPDAMNAAWGGISDYAELSLCLSAGHKTVKNILARKAFTVSMADEAHMVACDYVGIVSANQVPDKFERAGFHAVRSEFVDAPLIEELPMTVECRLKSYCPDTGILVGEIVNVSADERILDEKGSIDPAKLVPIVFDPVNNAYLKLGEKVGDAFSSGKALK